MPETTRADFDRFVLDCCETILAALMNGKFRTGVSIVITNTMQWARDRNAEQAATRDFELKSLFHQLWGNSKDATEYKKEQWLRLQELLQERGTSV